MVEDSAFDLGEILAASHLDAVCFVHPPNLRHLCGFTGSDGALVVTPDAAWFLTDSRYTAQASAQVMGADVREYRQKTEGVRALLCELGAARVGFEAAHMTVAQLQGFQGDASVVPEWVPLEKQLAGLRGIKSATQLESIRRAALINAAAFADVLPLIVPGCRESDLAMELEFSLRRHGGETKAFDFIVASGERGALPHGVASDRILASGELVTIDFGTRFGGYYSDETVTLPLGRVDDSKRRIFQTVLEAHDRAIGTVRPGVPLKEVDAVARDFIAEQGYGDYFGHGLGHGVGLEVHEYPTVSPRSDVVSEPGMVVTIEPGIYIPGVGGCRIEDMVLVTPSGCEVLTSIPKQRLNN